MPNMKQRYQEKQRQKQQAKEKAKANRAQVIPRNVRLLDGRVLKAMPFIITAYNPDGSPKTFELQPADAPHDMASDGACVLFALEDWIRAPQPGKAKVPKVLNEHELAYIAEIEAARGNRMLKAGEWAILEFEVDAIRDGTMGLTGPETIDERLERLNNHYP